MRMVKASDFFRRFAQMLADHKDMLDALDPSKASLRKMCDLVQAYAIEKAEVALVAPSTRELFLRFADLLEERRDLIEARDPSHLRTEHLTRDPDGAKGNKLLQLVALARAYGRDYAKIDLLGSGRIEGIRRGKFAFGKNK